MRILRKIIWIIVLLGVIALPLLLISIIWVNRDLETLFLKIFTTDLIFVSVTIFYLIITE